MEFPAVPAVPSVGRGPKTVITVLVFITILRIELLAKSATYKVPSVSIVMPKIRPKRAASPTPSKYPGSSPTRILVARVAKLI